MVLQSYPGELTARSQPCWYDVEGLDDPQPVRPKDSPTRATNTRGKDKRQRTGAVLGAAPLLWDTTVPPKSPRSATGNMVNLEHRTHGPEGAPCRENTHDHTVHILSSVPPPSTSRRRIQGPDQTADRLPIQSRIRPIDTASGQTPSACSAVDLSPRPVLGTGSMQRQCWLYLQHRDRADARESCSWQVSNQGRCQNRP